MFLNKTFLLKRLHIINECFLQCYLKVLFFKVGINIITLFHIIDIIKLWIGKQQYNFLELQVKLVL